MLWSWFFGWLRRWPEPRDAMPNDRESGIPTDAARYDKMLMDRGVGRRHACFHPPGLGGPWAGEFTRLLDRTGKDGFMAVLLGRPGTGKTQMATEWMRFVLTSMPDPKKMEQYAPGWLARHVLYRKASTLFREVRATFDTHDRNEDEVVSRFCNLQSLVIDEIDSRARTGFEERILRDILDERYSNLRETIIISNNRNRHEFLERQTEYLVSRLSETGLFIECNWPSFREK